MNYISTSIYKGSKRGLIILVEFSGTDFQKSHDRDFFEQVCNEERFYSQEGLIGSVYDYFRSQSYGQFELTFDIVGPVKLSETYYYYGKNGSDGNDMYAGAMVVEACQMVDEQVNFADYDWDGDGLVDQVLVIYAGRGEADGGGSNTIWPHEWELTESDYGSTLVLDGVNINTYAATNELSRTGFAGIGTICHEFSHCLGLPDMYDTFNTGNYGLGSWSIMASGNYNGAGYVPAGFTSYERYACGWVTPIELTTITEVDSMKALIDSPEVYMIRNDNCADEYLLIENRQRKSWDSKLAGSGMLILHVDYDPDIWANNLVNTCVNDNMAAVYDLPVTNNHQRCTIYRAGNRYDKVSLASDAYPYGSNTELCNTSTPAATLYNPNTDGSMLLNKGISNISCNSDGTMAFRFYNSPTDPGTDVEGINIVLRDDTSTTRQHRLVVKDKRLTIDGRYDLQGRYIK